MISQFASRVSTSFNVRSSSCAISVRRCTLIEPSIRSASSGWRLSKRKESRLLHQQYLRRFQRARVRRIAGRRRQGRLGKRLAGAKDVDDLFLARGVDAMNVDRALLRDVKALRGSAFAKEVIAFVERLNEGDVRDGIQIARPQAGEKLAAAERVDDRGLLKVLRVSLAMSISGELNRSQPKANSSSVTLPCLSSAASAALTNISSNAALPKNVHSLTSIV